MYRGVDFALRLLDNKYPGVDPPRYTGSYPGVETTQGQLALYRGTDLVNEQDKLQIFVRQREGGCAEVSDSFNCKIFISIHSSTY